MRLSSINLDMEFIVFRETNVALANGRDHKSSKYEHKEGPLLHCLCELNAQGKLSDKKRGNQHQNREAWKSAMIHSRVLKQTELTPKSSRARRWASLRGLSICKREWGFRSSRFEQIDDWVKPRRSKSYVQRAGMAFFSITNCKACNLATAPQWITATIVCGNVRNWLVNRSQWNAHWKAMECGQYFEAESSSSEQEQKADG